MMAVSTVGVRQGKRFELRWRAGEGAAMRLAFPNSTNRASAVRMALGILGQEGSDLPGLGLTKAGRCVNGGCR